MENKYAAYKQTSSKGVIRSMDATILEKIEDLQFNCRKVNNGMVAMRMILLIMHKLNINEAAIDQILGFCDRTKQMWIDRYAVDGVDGLYDLPRNGRPSNLTEEQKKDLKEHVEASTEKECVEKIITAEQLDKKIQADFKVEYSRSGVYNLLHKIGLSKFLPRPVHEKNDPEKIKKWLEELPLKIKEITDKNTGKKINFYFQDETRYGQKTIYTGIWGITGNKIEFENQDGFLNAWIYGVANPYTGERFGLILPVLNAQNMQIFLENFSEKIGKDEHVIMILDGSGAHKSKELNIPDNISFIFLPPYSPQLNPIERLWNWIKSHYLSFKKYNNIEEIIEKGACAWLKLTDIIVKSVCACDYLPKI